jgi:cell division septum initiation protein DivIVA
MDDHAKELSALAGTAKRTKSAAPHSAPMPIYDFEHLGETLSDSLVQTAEDLSAEAQRIANGLIADAQRLANDARTLAADIRMQVAEQSRLLADINGRLRASGEQMLEAHRKFNGS